MQKRGIHGVFQAHSARNLDFRLGTRLETLDHLVSWYKPIKPDWMSQKDYDDYPDRIKIREADVTQEMGMKKRFIIVTTLMTDVYFPKEKLVNFYKQRWKIETALKDLMDTFGMEHIAANYSDMVRIVL